ncbi:MAG TPA: asparagine synthase (glutamine-hydrolyzing) [Firmicutes bacterium]|nr:asparagine synthase (glutamine-hydrolyzing) [Bacillota bacterium]
MCGFIGIYNKNGVSGTGKADAAAMSHAIRHRGPDLDRAYGEGRAYFAFRRLSIIDLEGGAQPFVSDDGRYFAVYNGEVYNYLELREELVSRGVAFRTRSEIETLVALYENHGPSFINRLRGMFAFLIYDNKTGVLMAGRDPFGIKPLYYRETADGHVFASEMKAFLFDSGYDGFKVDPTLLQHYLTFQYVTEPDTITGDIRILPKGSYMLCDGEHTETECYYRPVFAPAKGSYAEKKLRLREAVERSVESHMLSDVPLGSFLSSGVDSAVITAVASKLSPGIKAFTVGFDVPGYSELEDAAAISAHLDIDHIKLQCTLKDFTDSYEKVIYHLDSPVGDPSVVAIYLISQEAARHVKVILSGEGSDELFGGYRQYATAPACDRLGRLPRFIKAPLAALARVLPPSVKGRGFLLRGLTPVEQRFVGNSFVFDELSKRRILKTFDPAVHFTDRTKDIYAQASGYGTLLKMQYCDLHTWLPSDILVKGDRLSMAHALEARVPYLDKEVFKAARSLCDRDKLSHDTTKYILRDTFSDLLNRETVVRPKKGYPVPVRVWLRGELYEWARHILAENPAEQYIDTAEALRLLELHRAGKGDYYHHIWVLLSFMTWYRLYIADAETTKRRVAEGEL